MKFLTVKKNTGTVLLQLMMMPNSMEHGKILCPHWGRIFLEVVFESLSAYVLDLKELIQF